MGRLVRDEAGRLLGQLSPEWEEWLGPDGDPPPEPPSDEVGPGPAPHPVTPATVQQPE